MYFSFSKKTKAFAQQLLFPPRHTGGHCPVVPALEPVRRPNHSHSRVLRNQTKLNQTFAAKPNHTKHSHPNQTKPNFCSQTKLNQTFAAKPNQTKHSHPNQSKCIQTKLTRIPTQQNDSSSNIKQCKAQITNTYS